MALLTCSNINLNVYRWYKLLALFLYLALFENSLDKKKSRHLFYIGDEILRLFIPLRKDGFKRLANRPSTSISYAKNATYYSLYNRTEKDCRYAKRCVVKTHKISKSPPRFAYDKRYGNNPCFSVCDESRRLGVIVLHM